MLTSALFVGFTSFHRLSLGLAVTIWHYIVLETSWDMTVRCLIMFIFINRIPGLNQSTSIFSHLSHISVTLSSHIIAIEQFRYASKSRDLRDFEIIPLLCNWANSSVLVSCEQYHEAIGRSLKAIHNTNRILHGCVTFEKKWIKKNIRKDALTHTTCIKGCGVVSRKSRLTFM